MSSVNLSVPLMSVGQTRICTMYLYGMPRSASLRNSLMYIRDFPGKVRVKALSERSAKKVMAPANCPSKSVRFPAAVSFDEKVSNVSPIWILEPAN